MTDPIESWLDPYVNAVKGRKALNVTILDVRPLTSVADAFIICSGRSHRQVSAIAEFIKQQWKKQKIQALSVEGLKEGHWALLDYGHVIIHIFYEPVRDFYDLEGLWIDARRIKATGLAQGEDDRTEGLENE